MKDQQNHPSETSSIPKPQWLEALEAQSWQAELLISSVVIFFLIRLPDNFLSFFEYLALKSGETSIGFILLGGFYTIGSIYAVIGVFMYHFAIRSLWIALLGLNSVYPDGIKIRSLYGLSENYWKQLKNDYPSLSDYNEKLDKIASTLFSQAALIVMFLITVGIVIFICFILFKIIIFFFPALKNYMGTFAIVMYFVIFLGLGLYNYAVIKIKKLTKEEAENYAYQRSKIFSKGLFSVFTTPVMYINNIVSTNATSQKTYILFAFLGGVFFGVVAPFKIETSPILDNFGSNEYMIFNNRQGQLLSYNYEDRLSETTPIFAPTIPSRNIKDEQLTLFIPSIDREIDNINFAKKLSLFKRIGSKMKETSLERIARQDSIRLFNLNAYKDFNKIFVNDIAYPDLSFQMYQHSHQNEKGILVQIPSQHFQKGENILEIRKAYFSDEGVQKIVRIPFYFEKN